MDILQLGVILVMLAWLKVRGLPLLDRSILTADDLAQALPPEVNRPGLAHLAFEVDDVDQTYEDLKAKGVEFFITPRNAGDIRLAFFRDPDGNELELFNSPTLRWK